jgi:microcystin-dependent protein
MTFVRPRARILETSTTSGSGPFALAGAADGSYNRFSAFMSVGDQTYVTVVEPGVAFWSGVATYSATNQITLTTVEETKGTFGAGTKEVMASQLASTSMFREDIAGAIVTGGTATAYTVASYRKYGTLAQLDGNIIAFTPHATNGQGATIAIDGLTAKPLRLSPGVSIESGVLVAGTPYLGLYNHTDGAVYLHGMGGNAYGIPLGAGMDYWGATAPSSAFAFPIGQAISRTTYANLFTLFGTTYGAGDGSTTFNLPDRRGRASAQVDPTTLVLNSATMTPDGATRGAIGGSQSNQLSTPNLPPYTPSGTITNGAITFPIVDNSSSGNGTAGSVVTGSNAGVTVDLTSRLKPSQATSTFAGSPQGGTSTAFTNMQPTILCNYIMRVL